MTMEGPLQILLLEDNAGDARLVKEYLRKSHSSRFDVTHVDRMAKGLKALDEKRFNLVILDMHLPDGTGEEALKGIRQKAPKLSVIILTGTEQDEERAVQMIQGGAQDYLMKDSLVPELLRRAILYAIERKRLERLKDDFISTVSHELRTPLAVLELGLGNLQSGIAGPITSKQTEILNRNVRNMKRLSSLIDNLLDLSRLQSGRTKIWKRSVNLASFIHEVAQNFQVSESGPGPTLREEIASGLPEIEVDTDLLAQVLTNILSNALRYAKKEIVIRAIALAGAADIPSVEVSVSNDGPGIPKEEIGKLFDKFVQLDRETRKSSYKGTGLGLAICKEIIEQHHGKIWVESDGVEGVSFHFTL